MKVLLWFLQIICIVVLTVILNLIGYGYFNSSNQVLAIFLNVLGAIVIAGIFAYIREVLT